MTQTTERKITRLSTSKKGYGGNIYELMTDQVLKKYFGDAYSVEFNLFHLKGFYRLLEAPGYLIKNFKFSIRRHLMKIRSFQTAFFNFSGPGLTIVYHIDSAHSPRAAKLFQDIVEKWFYFWLNRDQHLVVISKYWLNFLTAKGFRNVHLIYCGFNLADYKVSPADTEEFKNRFKLTGTIIYIGNPQRKKGTALTYAALKDQGYTLVCSGEGELDIPVRQLKLNFHDYICLLKVSAAVVTMSQFLEGWNRVAHEAMLVGTPVVGSGWGGMEEVLLGGQQIICTDFSRLAADVKLAISQRDHMATTGYNFAIQFSTERFENAWLDLIKKTYQT